MRTEQEVTEAINNYGDTIRRICLVHLKNQADTEDIFQNTFLKYTLSDVVFEDEEHQKAWLIRVAVNSCKDLLKSAFRRHTVALDELINQPAVIDNEHKEILEAVLSLPNKYKDVIYLFFYEGYSAVEISGILGKNVNTIYTRLSRAKLLLKDILGGEDYE